MNPFAVCLGDDGVRPNKYDRKELGRYDDPTLSMVCHDMMFLVARCDIAIII